MVTLPDAGSRFMSMIVISEDEYTPAVYYGTGSRTFTKEQVGMKWTPELGPWIAEVKV
jgi:hypothetical protein